MKEYINRKKLNNIFDEVCSNEVLRKQIGQYIDTMPLEDVRENKHSRWVGVVNLFDGNTYYHCSGCGCSNPYDKFEISPNKTFPNYCPNCGDKMYVER